MIDIAHVRPWQGAIRASLARSAGGHRIEEIQYTENGTFTRVLRTLGGTGPPDYVTALDHPALGRLLAELDAELELQPLGVDTFGLAVFVELIRAALGAASRARWPEPARDGRAPTSHRFDGARFGTVVRSPGGMLYGQVELGADVSGTVADDNHTLSFEQHLAAWPRGGVYHLLSAEDQGSLGRALEAGPPADPAWRSILEDAKAGHGIQ
jgi:hypothetical protein